jgi:xanthine dehydrogenase iron-sulfur cluster and FAD-binding subunit A
MRRMRALRQVLPTSFPVRFGQSNIRSGRIQLTITKFGCGVGLCGACMVHIGGKRAFSC